MVKRMHIGSIIYLVVFSLTLEATDQSKVQEPSEHLQEDQFLIELGYSSHKGLNIIPMVRQCVERRHVSCSLKNATVTDVLKEILKQVDCDYQLKPWGILIFEKRKGLASGRELIPKLRTQESPETTKSLNKMKSIIYPQVKFNSLELTKVIDLLSNSSGQLDFSNNPQKGVKIISGFKPKDENPLINLSVRNLTLENLLELVCAKVGYEAWVTKDAVIIRKSKNVADSNPVWEDGDKVQLTDPETYKGKDSQVVYKSDYIRIPESQYTSIPLLEALKLLEEASARFDFSNGTTSPSNRKYYKGLK